MRVQFLGAAKQVGGSCQLFEVDDLKILIDVGLVQKNDIRSDMIFNTKEFTFNPKEIDYVILTHAHIDHIGLIPALVKAGYSGPILCTEPTMKISEISLKDCAFIWQREIEKALKSVEVRKGKIKLNNGTLCAPYSVEEAEMSMQFFRGYGFDKEIVLNDNVKFYFRNAGHILGAASIEFHIFENEKDLISYVRGIQSNSKIDSNAIVEPSDMPGYDDKIIMASGSFTQGSSIELSCDGPLRYPYIAYQQGSISCKYGKIIVERAINSLLDNK